MVPAVVPAFGLPEYFHVFVLAMYVVAALSLIAGLAFPTYVRAVAVPVVLGLGWIALTHAVGIAIDKDILRIAVGFVLITVVAHTLRRLAVAAWQRTRKS